MIFNFNEDYNVLVNGWPALFVCLLHLFRWIMTLKFLSSDLWHSFFFIFSFRVLKKQKLECSSILSVHIKMLTKELIFNIYKLQERQRSYNNIWCLNWNNVFELFNTHFINKNILIFLWLLFVHSLLLECSGSKKNHLNLPIRLPQQLFLTVHCWK